MDTSPGGDYYTSPSSPTSSSRNWTEDMEGGGAGDGGGAGLPVGVTRRGTTYSSRHCLRARELEAGLDPSGLPGIVVTRLQVKSGLKFPELFGSAQAGENVVSPRPDFPALCPSVANLCGVADL